MSRPKAAHNQAITGWRVFSRIDMLSPDTIYTETYLVVGAYEKKARAESLIRYMKTRFFRFLVAQFMYSHHITKDAYSFVPVLDMGTEWTDEQLYKRYSLTKDEIAFIESKIRPMPANGGKAGGEASDE